MAGKPVFSGTRIPLDLILKKLAQKMDVDEVIKDYPRLKKEAIQAALYYAGQVVANEEIHPLSS